MSRMDELIALLLPATGETLLMVAVPTALSCALGLVVGVVLVATEPGGLVPASILHRALGALVNVTRSVPFIILMVAIVPLTRLLVGTSIGTLAAMVPLVVAAIPYVARLVETGLKEVPQGITDALIAMGATPFQIIRHGWLSEAWPALIRGATLTAISLVSYSAMAGAVGGGGLGDLAVRYGYQRMRTDVMLATVLVLLVLVQGLQFLGERLASRLDRR